MDRRQFLKKSTITVAVTSTCLCSLGSCATITKSGRTPAINSDALAFSEGILTIDLSKETNLEQVGGAVKIIHNDIPEGMIIARVDDDRFAIASLLCPHRGVEVEYNHSHGHFKCASLGSSKFALDGEFISGAAEKPLKQYEASLSDNTLTIRL
jgi:Rieske Fe-S protein